MKPSQMGLHSKVRPVFAFKSGDRRKQVNEIIQFTEDLYDFIFNFLETPSNDSLEITQKFVRFMSKAFTFPGYEDDEIYHMLLKASEMKRKKRSRS